MKMEKTVFSQFRKDVIEALKPIQEKYEVEVEAGKIKYDSAGFTLVLEVANGSKEEKNKVDFEKVCSWYNLEKEDFGKKFNLQGKNYTIVGIDTKKRKYPIMVELNGEIRLMTREAVLAGLGRGKLEE